MNWLLMTVEKKPIENVEKGIRVGNLHFFPFSGNIFTHPI